MRRAETSITGRSLHQASTTTSAETWDTTGSQGRDVLNESRLPKSTHRERSRFE